MFELGFAVTEQVGSGRRHGEDLGHYVVEALPLTPGGDWELAVAVRVSEFDQYDTRLDVPVR